MRKRSHRRRGLRCFGRRLRCSAPPSRLARDVYGTAPKFFLLGLGAFAALAAVGAQAQTCPSKIWPRSSISQRDTPERLRFIERGLADGRADNRLWANSWGIAWSVLTVVNATVAATIGNKEDRKDWIVDAIATPLGIIPTWVRPPQILSSDAKELFAQPDRGCETLRKAETLLDAYAKNDAKNSGWVVHASNAAVNVFLGLIVGLGFKHWESGFWTVASGIPLGELQILTYPSSASNLRERYEKGDLSEAPQASLLDRSRIVFSPLNGGGLVGLNIQL